MKKIFIVLFIVSIYTSCKHKKEETQEAAKYLITSPIIKDTVITKDYVSQIHSYKHIEIRALEKGYLQTISVDEGQHLKKGQRMFNIMPNVYRAELQKFKAEENVAEIEYKNTKLLADENVVSKNELAMAKANFNKAKAKLIAVVDFPTPPLPLATAIICLAGFRGALFLLTCSPLTFVL